MALMATSLWSSFKYFLTILSIASPVLTTSAFAQDTPLTERITYVNSCRRIISTAEVFNNSSLSPLSSRVGTVTLGTNVTLTGVLAPGKAQVALPNSDRTIRIVGWIDATHLGPCSGTVAVTPAPATGSGQTPICYRVAANMIVRSGPFTQSSVVGSFRANDVIHTTTNPATERVSPNTAPDYGRRWLQVKTYNGTGWVSETGLYGAGSNLTQLPTSQCQ